MAQKYINKKLSYRRETARQLHVFLGSLTDRTLHWTPLLSQEWVKLRTSNLADIFRGSMRTKAL